MIENICKTTLEDVLVINHKVYVDERGWFIQQCNSDELCKIINRDGHSFKLIQDNTSKSECNVIRGLHYQLKYPQAKLVTVLQGGIIDVVVDIRKRSLTFGKHLKVILEAGDGKSLFIPEGYAHGFRSYKSNTIVNYKVSEVYHPEDQYGVRWNDPDLAIDWLKIWFKDLDDVIVSQKDKDLPCLHEILDYNLPECICLT